MKKKNKILRKRKTLWERAKRDRKRLVRLKDIYYNQISPILKNIKSLKVEKLK